MYIGPYEKYIITEDATEITKPELKHKSGSITVIMSTICDIMSSLLAYPDVCFFNRKSPQIPTAFMMVGEDEFKKAYTAMAYRIKVDLRFLSRNNTPAKKKISEICINGV